MSEPTPGFRIEVITAFTQIGADDEEGLMAWLDAGHHVWMPMVASNQERVDQLRGIAESLFSAVPYAERRFVDENVLNEVAQLCDELAETLDRLAGGSASARAVLAKYHRTRKAHHDPTLA